MFTLEKSCTFSPLPFPESIIAFLCHHPFLLSYITNNNIFRFFFFFLQQFLCKHCNRFSNSQCQSYRHCIPDLLINQIQLCIIVSITCSPAKLIPIRECLYSSNLFNPETVKVIEPSVFGVAPVANSDATVEPFDVNAADSCALCFEEAALSALKP